MSHNTQLKIVLLLSALLLAGCGASKSMTAEDSTSFSSTGVANPSQYFSCNNIPPQDSSYFTGQITIYTDSSGNYDLDAIRVNLTSISSAFLNDSSANLAFEAWAIPVTGQTTQSQQLYFHFETNDSSHTPISGEMTSVNNSTISTLMSNSQSFLASSSVTDFLTKTSIVVTGLSQYQVLHLQLYNSSGVFGQGDMLIPYFLADPNQYASTHDATLAELHPFYSEASQGENWNQIAQQMCL